MSNLIESYKVFLSTLDKDNVLNYMFYCSSILDSQIELYDVLKHFDVDVSVHSNEDQIECILPSHFGADRHKSARYYSKSDTGVARVHCFKCDCTLSGFWLFHRMLRDQDKKSLDILIEYIDTFKPAISKDLFYVEDENSLEAAIEIKKKSFKNELEEFRNLKKRNIKDFKLKLLNYITI